MFEIKNRLRWIGKKQEFPAWDIDERLRQPRARRTLQQTRAQGYEPKRLGAEVRRLREEKGLSQEALAKSAEMSGPGLLKLEQGEVVPSIPILERVAGVLGADLADLIRTGYDRQGKVASSTAAELNHLVGQLTEAQLELALGLVKVVAQQKQI